MARLKKITVKVVAEPRQPARRISLRHGSQVGDLLRKMGLMREEFIVMAKGRVVAEFEPLKDGDQIRLIRVFSGG